jgi:putative phage-type endonuclease
VTAAALAAVVEEDIALVNYGTRENWLAARFEGIGASESAALFDLSPWDSIVSLWAKKTLQIEGTVLSGEWLDWGILLEPILAQRYSDKTGRKVWRLGEYCVRVHPRYPFMRSTPDYWVIDAPDMPGRGGLQIKNASFFKVTDWMDEDGELRPPPYIECQVQHEMACSGLQWTSVCVLIGGNQFHWFDIHRNEVFITELEAQCEWFWGLVERKGRPPIDGSVWTNEALKKLHPKDNGQTIELSTDAVEWLSKWEAARAAKKVADAEETAAHSQLLALLGDNTFGKLPNDRLLSLKTQDGGGYQPPFVDRYSYRVLRTVKEKAPKKTRSKKGKAT